MPARWPRFWPAADEPARAAGSEQRRPWRTNYLYQAGWVLPFAAPPWRHLVGCGGAKTIYLERRPSGAVYAQLDRSRG